MNRKVLVFGTDHRYQRRSADLTELQHQQSASEISAVVRVNKVLLLAEENSQEALAEHDLVESAVQVIARHLGVAHYHCDPDRRTRNDCGIQQEGETRVSGFLGGWSETQMQRRIEASYRIRECYWLEQILGQNLWPTLFICGAEHVSPFCTLLKCNHVQSELVAMDWHT